MNKKVDAATLKALFSTSELPGWNAQHFMSPTFRDEQLKLNADFEHEAAVGIILFYKNEDLSVLFIQRTEDKGPHSRQIAFPGGTRESGEELLETAYREIDEEIGISKINLKYIGTLSSLYIPVSRFMVYPFVFFCNELPGLKLCDEEVEGVLIYNVNKFLMPEVLSSTIIQLKNKDYKVPCFKVQDKIIWGATSMIWNECLTILKPILNEQNKTSRTNI